MRGSCQCPRCGTPLVQKGGSKGELKAKAQMFLTMQAERTYVCPKCGYETKTQTMLIK